MHASVGHMLITTESVDPEVRKDGSKRLILSWLHTCPGYLVGKTISTEN